MKSKNVKVNLDRIPFLMESEEVKSKKAKINRTGLPILMEDGKVIEMDESIIIDKAIVDGMKYISNMTIGLSTGQLSMDNEYIDFRDKIIKDLIEEQSIKVCNRLGQEEKIIKGKYKNGYKIHKEVLDRMYARNKEESKDDFIMVNLGDSLVKCGNNYKLIDYDKFKKDREEIEEKLAFKKVAKKKVAKKKVAKKKVVKSKVVKKKLKNVSGKK